MSNGASSSGSPTKVAIACQGGGSHTAFTAGALQELFRNWNDDDELVGISGSSGGAFNALAAWYGIVTADKARSIELLNALWDDLAASELSDRVMNDVVVGLARLWNTGFPLPQMSPYDMPGPELGKEEIRTTLERHIDFDRIPDLCGHDTPELIVGTVNINAGIFETFRNEAVTPEAILASAAVPAYFEAVEIDGHYHWDGLFSQNPPVHDLMVIEPARKPDELWVIQINPQERPGEPRSLEEIADRRNELSGNISLNQELRTIERVNEWIDEGHLPASDFSKVDVHRFSMGKQYHCSTKVDRNPAFIQELMELGEHRAGEFLAAR